MDQLLRLLERKNLCFRSFHGLCEAFLDRIARGDADGILQFQAQRQGLIDVLESIEKEVGLWLERNRDAHADGATGPDADEKREIFASRLKELLDEKEGMVNGILDLDLQILAHVDRFKDDAIRRLQSLQAGRRTIGAYRSPLESVESAQGGKNILDREA